MGLLGDFLEMFYGGGDPLRSVQAVIRCESKQVARGPTSRRSAIGREKSAPQDRSSEIAESRVWAKLPDLVRVETTSSKKGRPTIEMELGLGDKLLQRTSKGNLRVEEFPSARGRSEAIPLPYRRHFDTGLIRRFLADLRFESLGECEVAGRHCVRMRAIPLPGDGIWPHWLPTEADEFEFAADLNYPSLLSIACRLAGEEFSRMDVMDVAYNGEIDESLFSEELFTAGTVLDPDPVTQPLSQAEAIAQVPFVILLPTKGVEGGDPHFHYSKRSAKAGGECLMVAFPRSGLNRFWFGLHSQADSVGEAGLEWEELQVSGRTFRLSDPGEEGGMMVLTFEQEGTHVTIYSSQPLSELLEVALSFAPVRG